MKKILMLLTVAAMAGFVSCGGKDDGPVDPVVPVVEKMTPLNAKSGLGSYIIKQLSGGAVAAFPVSLYSVEATGSSLELLTIKERPVSVLNITLCNNPASLTNPTLPAGTYTVSTKVTPEANMCFAANSSYISLDKDGNVKDELSVKSGKVEVAVSGSNYTIKAVVILSNKKELTATYTGPITFYSAPFSGLGGPEEEFEAPLEGVGGNLIYFGQGFEEVDADIWQLVVGDNTNGAFGLLLALPKSVSSLVDGIPAGKYVVKGLEEYAEGDYICARANYFIDSEDNIMAGMSWWLSKNMQIPIQEGALTVVKNGNEYTLTFEFIDDSLYEHPVYGTWIGEITPEEPTPQSMPTLMPAVQNKMMKLSKPMNVRPSVNLSSVMR